MIASHLITSAERRSHPRDAMRSISHGPDSLVDVPTGLADGMGIGA